MSPILFSLALLCSLNEASAQAIISSRGGYNDLDNSPPRRVNSAPRDTLSPAERKAEQQRIAAAAARRKLQAQAASANKNTAEISSLNTSIREAEQLLDGSRVITDDLLKVDPNIGLLDDIPILDAGDREDSGGLRVYDERHTNGELPDSDITPDSIDEPAPSASMIRSMRRTLGSLIRSVRDFFGRDADTEEETAITIDPRTVDEVDRDNTELQTRAPWSPANNINRANQTERGIGEIMEER